MSTTESVTVASLEASINFDGHSEFLSALHAREDLDSARRDSWKARLDEARARSQDPDLYLAVVGEFSSGKSTLVNALIREALLPADVLPATTATAVLVRSGPQRQLRVEYVDGRTEEITDGEVIRERVERLITIEEIARTVTRLTIDHPAEALRDGLVAVDLPGSNVENARHVAVAGQTIRDLCDTALVAIPATIPVSETLAEFLHIHLDEVLHRCIFIVTKIDCLPVGDRARILATVQGRLAAKLGVSSPVVLGASASAVLGEPLLDGTDPSAPLAAGEAYGELREQFLETERRIVRFFQERRKLILLERSATLLAARLDEVQEDLRAAGDRCQQDRDAVAASLPPPLGPFLTERRARHGQAVEARLQALADHLLKACTAFRQQTLQALWSSLAAARNRAQVIHAATYGADTLVKRARGSTREELQKVSVRIGPAIREEIATFEACFRERYEAVAAPESFVADANFSESMSNDWAEWTRPAPTHVKQEQKHQSSQRAGGALLGAVVGFLVFLFVLDKGGCNSCGIALLILAASPFIGAQLAGNQPALVDSLRKAYWSDLGPSIEAFFSQIDSVV